VRGLSTRDLSTSSSVSGGGNGGAEAWAKQCPITRLRSQAALIAPAWSWQLRTHHALRANCTISRHCAHCAQCAKPDVLPVLCVVCILRVGSRAYRDLGRYPLPPSLWCSQSPEQESGTSPQARRSVQCRTPMNALIRSITLPCREPVEHRGTKQRLGERGIRRRHRPRTRLGYGTHAIRWAQSSVPGRTCALKPLPLVLLFARAVFPQKSTPAPDQEVGAHDMASDRPTPPLGRRAGVECEAGSENMSRAYAIGTCTSCRLQSVHGPRLLCQGCQGSGVVAPGTRLLRR
jgi:hypothetical protein